MGRQIEIHRRPALQMKSKCGKAKRSGHRTTPLCLCPVESAASTKESVLGVWNASQRHQQKRPTSRALYGSRAAAVGLPAPESDE